MKDNTNNDNSNLHLRSKDKMIAPIPLTANHPTAPHFSSPHFTSSQVTSQHFTSPHSNTLTGCLALLGGRLGGLLGPIVLGGARVVRGSLRSVSGWSIETPDCSPGCRPRAQRGWLGNARKPGVGDSRCAGSRSSGWGQGAWSF